MNDPSVFRSVVNDPEPPTEAAVTDAPVDTAGSTDTHVDTLLATYQDDQGKPYAAKYLEIEDVWKRQPELKLEVETIEGYLRDQVSKGKLDNSIRAAEKFLKDLEKKAHINPYEPTNNRITKILAYIDFQKVVYG